jgi:hypothetical protein
MPYMTAKSLFKNLANQSLEDDQIELAINDNQNIPEKLMEARANIKALENTALELQEAIQDFKKESNERILNNGRIIAQFKNMIPLAKDELIPKYTVRMDELEMKNNEMKDKLGTYIFEGKCKWISCKNEFKHEIACLEKALKDFSIERF